MMPITTGQAAAGFLKYLAEPAARSLALGCLATIALAAFRVKRVPLRLLVWTTTLYAALAMPFLGAFAPSVTFSVPARAAVVAQNIAQRFGQSFRGDAVRTVQAQGSASSSTLGNNVTSVTHQEVKAMNADTRPLHVANTRHEQQAAVGIAALPDLFTQPTSATRATREAILPVTQTSRAQRGFWIPWIALGLGIYFAVTVLFFARLLVGIFFSWRLERASEEIHEREAIRLVRMRACMGGLESTPRLAETKMLSVPATLGVLHPVILLPMDWREWDEAKLDAIVAHEVSHVARRDALTQRLSLIHRAIFWFSPLAWWIDKQVTELAEEASDEAALAGGADQARYAETLLEFFAELEAAPGRIHWEGISMANGCRAERRVERILSWKGSNSMKKWLAVMIVAVAAPLIVVVGSAHPLLAQEDNAPKKVHNVIKPGGPVAPALPAAPKAAGVVAPAAMTPAPPTPGAVAPALPGAPTEPGPGVGELAPGPTPQAPSTMPAPASAPTVGGPAAFEIRPTPALMRVPGAPAHPPIVAGPIANGPVALGASLIPTGPAGFGSAAPVASAAPVTLMSSMAPPAPQAMILAGDSVSDQDARAQLRMALKELQDADAQSGSASAQIRAEQAALMKAQQASAAADLMVQVHAAQRALKRARSMMDEKNDASQMRGANEALAEAKRDLEEAAQSERDGQERSSSVTIRNGSYTSGSGPRYVMMTSNNNVSMSGSDEDLNHARNLRKKMGGDFIWFERDEKSYVITDPAFIAKAKALFAPEEELGKQQEELGRQQEALGKQQEALGNQMEDVKVKIQDITPQLEEVRARLKELQSTGATQRELGRLQGELGRLQGEVGRFQAEAGVGQRDIGHQQGELGRKQGELGRRQGELGRKQGELARQASRELRGMFDDAIAKGIAKAE
jgi:beta-lactamase regulating signal transducer with metallopeptidase domain